MEKEDYIELSMKAIEDMNQLSKKFKSDRSMMSHAYTFGIFAEKILQYQRLGVKKGSPKLNSKEYHELMHERVVTGYHRALDYLLFRDFEQSLGRQF